ncbi:TPA: pyruvate kinase [Patescibacteria group bacterium]|nr:pyruvate kinase [Patescibacteria group bacterium]
MTAPKFCKTKIVATIGPSSWDMDILTQMVEAGVDIARINASFADFDELKRVSQMIRKISQRVSLILDTQGNKIRVAGFETERVLKKGQLITLIPSTKDITNEDQIQITYDNLNKDISRNTIILLDDGNIELKVKEIVDNNIVCTVQNHSILHPHKTVNIPNSFLNFPLLTQKDKQDIEYAVDLGYDFVALSFVQSSKVVKLTRELLGDSDINIISKIENQAGIDNFDDILKYSDGIMIARGDLGVEISFEQIPMIQKQLIYRCRAVGKPVIVATQMLESMRYNIRATRAEVSDVANSVIDGADAIMLSAETSTGKYPIESVETMNTIALSVENILTPQVVYGRTTASLDTDELCKSVFNLTNSLNLKSVLVISQSGKSVQSLSRHRLSIPIYEVTNDFKRVREDNLLRGVKCYYAQSLSDDRDKSIERAVEIVFSYGELDFDDKIAIISGSSIKNKSINSILEIATVKDILGR